MGSKYYCSDCGEIYDSSLLKTDLYSAYDMPCPKQDAMDQCLK